MAGSLSEEYGAGRSSEGISSTQRCQSGEALAEWRSSEQVENGVPSTSPPYWDSDDDDDYGPKPSELYGKFTWKIENFSQVNKKELRSNAFEVGGYKWYILIYPQGCDVCNHLSLFLCVANHDKLLPGWSHFAQFTIAVVNKDAKKSKYSDTLHRFWKKEHDWGWKKFMELSKVQDGFVDGDTLVIKAQVQVIRERADRPFRCLDCLYRRELVRVYLTNVEQICRRFVEERRGKLGKLIDDKARWSSFCSFWLGVDQSTRWCMSREKSDMILKVVVKHFFIEKEVTSTLVMDSLYSGLKALEAQSKSKKGRAKQLEIEETPAPIIRVENDMFVLEDDVLLLLERAALEPLPPKDEKGPQNRTKDGNSGEEFNKDSIERDERRLTELGRRTVEIFVLAHIFSNRIEVAYQEAVALKRQEELIREEEAAGQAELEQKAKRVVAEKEKRSKKKQAKQRRGCRKGKDRGRDEKSDVAVQEKHQQGNSTDGRIVDLPEKPQQISVLEKPDAVEDVSDVSDIGDSVAESQPELEDRDASPVNWDTDTSEIHLAAEVSSSGMSIPVQNGRVDKRPLSVMDDSSSTCSTDSVPSLVMNGTCKGNLTPNHKSQTSPGRGKTQRGKEALDHTPWGHEENHPSGPTSDSRGHNDASDSLTASEPEPETVVESLKDRIQWLEQHLVEKEKEVSTLQRKLSVKDPVDIGKEVSTLQRKLSVKDPVDMERPVDQSNAVGSSASSPSSPTRRSPVTVQPKSVAESVAESVTVDEISSNSPRKREKGAIQMTPQPQISDLSKPEAQRPPSQLKTPVLAVEKPTVPQVSLMSRPLSAPLIPGPRPTAPVVSMVQTAPSLARSVSAAGRLGTDASPTTHGYVPHSYRNAIVGKIASASTSGFVPSHSNSASNLSPAYSQPSSMITSSMMHSRRNSQEDHGMVRSGFTFGTVTPEILQNRPQWMEERSQGDASNVLCSPSLLNDMQNLDLYGSSSHGSRTYFSEELPAGFSSRQGQGSSADEFPHLDIINYLFDEEHSIGKAAKAGAVFNGTSNGYRHSLNRQSTFPSDMSMSMDMAPSVNCCRLDRPSPAIYNEDGMQRMYGSSSSHFDRVRGVIPHVGLSGYSNGQIDGVMQNQWCLDRADLSLLGMRNAEGDGYPFQQPEYSNLACGVNGYTVFRPSNGH